jgi:hypothetical protein
VTNPMHEKMVAKAAELCAALREMDPHRVADRCGAEYADGLFRIVYFGECYLISFPDLEVRLERTNEVCKLKHSSMFYYYMQTADGTPMADQWIAFRELPGGMFYHQAYQGYSGDRLARAIANRITVFERAARSLGGTRLGVGDAAYAFQALPRIRVAAIYNAADEDFPATANVLFDAAASHYMPTDALAGVGSTLVDRLTASQERDEPE